MSFLGSMFGGSKAPAPPPMQAAPSRADPAVEEARKREVIASGKIRGAGANLLTGNPYGDTSAPSVARKALLGE